MSKFIEEMNAAMRQQQNLGNSTLKVELTENGLRITNIPYADMYNLAGKTPSIAVVDNTEPAQVSQEPVNISEQLREYAGDNGYSHNDYADIMLAAADENEALKLRVTELEAESRTKHEYAMQMLVERAR